MKTSLDCNSVNNTATLFIPAAMISHPQIHMNKTTLKKLRFRAAGNRPEKPEKLSDPDIRVLRILPGLFTDNVSGPVFGLHIGLSYIFTDNSDAQQLDAAQKTKDTDHTGPACDRNPHKMCRDRPDDTDVMPSMASASILESG